MCLRAPLKSHQHWEGPRLPVWTEVEKEELVGGVMVVVEKLRDEALDMLVWAFEVRLRYREVELASAKVEVVDLTCYFGWTSFQGELV